MDTQKAFICVKNVYQTQLCWLEGYITLNQRTVSTGPDLMSL